MELHSTTWSRRVDFLLHAPSASTPASTPILTTCTFMGPNIANRALPEQQQDVIKRVCPRSYAEAAQQIQPTKKEAGDRPKYKGIDVEVVAIRPDIMKGREDQGSDDGGHDAGHERPTGQDFFRGTREQSHEDDADEQHSDNHRTERHHQGRRPAKLRQ